VSSCQDDINTAFAVLAAPVALVFDASIYRRRRRSINIELVHAFNSTAASAKNIKEASSKLLDE
jgi:hypothetical protein